MIEIQPLKQPIPNVFRTITEHTAIMVHCDERVQYTSTQKHWQEYDPKSEVKLVISRPIWPEEQLNTSIMNKPICRKENEKVGDLTDILDAIFIIKEEIEIGKLFKRTPTETIAHTLAYHYYDCLSDGCPIWMLRIIYEVCQDQRIDKGEKVYPNGKGDDTWDTIEDFLESFKDNPILKQTLLLPPPQAVTLALE